MILIVGICGNSGSGKTTLINNCFENNPDLFNRVEQMTTRRPRVNEVEHYNFVTESFYDYFKSKGNLTAITKVDGSLYGSIIPTFATSDGTKKKINILALNTEGLLSLKKTVEEMDNVRILNIGLIKPELSNEELANRQHRDIEKELTFTNDVDILVGLGTGEYLNYKEFIGILKDEKFI